MQQTRSTIVSWTTCELWSVNRTHAHPIIQSLRAEHHCSRLALFWSERMGDYEATRDSNPMASTALRTVQGRTAPLWDPLAPFVRVCLTISVHARMVEKPFFSTAQLGERSSRSVRHLGRPHLSTLAPLSVLRVTSAAYAMVLFGCPRIVRNNGRK